MVRSPNREAHGMNFWTYKPNVEEIRNLMVSGTSIPVRLADVPAVEASGSESRGGRRKI